MKEVISQTRIERTDTGERIKGLGMGINRKHDFVDLSLRKNFEKPETFVSTNSFKRDISEEKRVERNVNEVEHSEISLKRRKRRERRKKEERQERKLRKLMKETRR